MSGPPGPVPYDPAFLQEQRERLTGERQRVLDDMHMLSEDMQGWRDHEDAGIGQHMADDATALSEQELDVSLLEASRAALGEIDDALRRLEDGTYGWDEEGACWIREDRLRALPWARREIAGQQRYDDRLDPGGITDNEDDDGQIARPY